MNSTQSVTSRFSPIEMPEQPFAPDTRIDLAEVDELKKQNDRLLYDAARWNHAKNKLYRQLGFSSPLQMQLTIDLSMSKECEK